MSPLVLDIAYLVLAVGLLAGGWQQGFVKAAGSLAALVISIVVSIWGIDLFKNIFGPSTLGNPLTIMVVFLILTLVISKILGLFVWVLDAIRRLLSFIPLVGLINSVGGLGVGLVQVLLASAFFGWILVTLPPENLSVVPAGSQAVDICLQIFKSTTNLVIK
jgi:hypothetical protein